MPSVLQNLTWDDIKDLPESAERTEIIDGELVLSPVPSHRHQRIASSPGVLIFPFAEHHGLGEFFSAPVHVVLAPHLNVEPDLCFVARARLGILGDIKIDGPPDLIVEILSPGNRNYDLVTKLARYASHGVGEYWVVDPEANEFLVYRRKGERFEAPERHGKGSVFESACFPGLAIDPTAVL